MTAPAYRVEQLLDAPVERVERLAREAGAAVLLHLPAAEVVNLALLRLGARATEAMRHGQELVAHTFALLRAFRDMELAFVAATPTGDLTLGRDPRVDVVVGEASVSKHHATLRWGRDGFWLRDAGSRNGTFVNAVRLSGERALQDGDTLSLGDASLVFVTSPTLCLQLQGLRGHG